MVVTLFTDGSFDPNKFIGTWAILFQKTTPLNFNIIKKSGICPFPLKGAWEAELFSIIIGIKFALENYKLSTLIIRNDCEEAIRMIEKKQNTRSEIDKAICDSIKLYKQKFNIKLWHIKGHNKHKNAKINGNVQVHESAISLLRGTNKTFDLIQFTEKRLDFLDQKKFDSLSNMIDS